MLAHATTTIATAASAISPLNSAPIEREGPVRVVADCREEWLDELLQAGAGAPPVAVFAPGQGQGADVDLGPERLPPGPE